MKKLLATVALVAMTTTAQAEVNYDFKNAEHKADKECIAVFSVARDALFNDVKVFGDTVWLKTIEPTAEVVKARNTITDLQNGLILKYAYSKQLNTHVDTYKFLVNQRINEQGPAYLEKAIKECK